MNGSSLNGSGGVSVSTSKGSSSSASSYSSNALKSNESIGIYNGPAGVNRREWRLRITPQSLTTNALQVEYKTAEGVWQTTSVYNVN